MEKIPTDVFSRNSPISNVKQKITDPERISRP